MKGLVSKNNFTHPALPLPGPRRRGRASLVLDAVFVKNGVFPKQQGGNR